MAPASRNSTFRAGLVQMRSGRTPGANVDTASRLISEAKAAGADYILTPEMTNVVEVKREELFKVLSEEESDVSLAALRDLARKNAVWLHIGSLALKVSHDKAANRSFLIDPSGEVAARYDKIHMFDVDLPNG